MRKYRVLALALSLLLCLSALGLAVAARGMVDNSKQASLSLTYDYKDTAFAGVSVKLWRVGAFTDIGTFELCGKFAGYPMEIGAVKSQSEWDQIALTSSSFVDSDKLLPDAEAVTDSTGKASFGELPLGLYLVGECRIDVEGGYCRFAPFMLVLPGVDAEDDWTYTVDAKPKPAFFEVPPQPEDIKYSVTKLWKDAGHETERPAGVTIELYKNAELQNTVTLSEANGWMHEWTAPDDGSVWTAVEKDTAPGYTVSLSRKGNSFYVINTLPDDPPLPPTGDIAGNYIALALAALLAGAGLIFVGFRRRSSEI